jgi:diketogulonate reductase-like aldo/keto reductase
MEKQKDTATLSNGASMPLVGLGTFQLMDKDAIVNAILNLGYRHLDTAWLYNNEEIIGKTLAEVFEKSGGKIKREDLFITTKIWVSQFENPKKELQGSLDRLQLSYVDLYLIHWPAQFFGEQKKALHVLWPELESLVDAGMTRSIGLSNFNV